MRQEEKNTCEDEKKNVQRTTPLPSIPTTVENGKENNEEFEEKNKRRALEIVQMWRVRGRVPLAIDAHAQIVELQLMDEEVMREKKRRRNNLP